MDTSVLSINVRVQDVEEVKAVINAVKQIIQQTKEKSYVDDEGTPIQFTLGFQILKESIEKLPK